MDYQDILIGITDIAVALAGFTGVVVAFGSRSGGAWHPGDRLRLGFMMEASLTAGGFALFALVLYTSQIDIRIAWALSSGLWAAFMLWSLYSSRQRIQENTKTHHDIDSLSNHVVFFIFLSLIVLQLVNVFYWCDFIPFFIALTFNLVGAAMQFSRLIVSAFNG